ncbi:STAS domain-containing protein [Jannaschia sp. KMU-145]|uniref:STAS domain-containing protein n=1 Tax=Jannaschia halovivens TaxID=3388667 RepID=UPI00396AEFF2
MQIDSRTTDDILILELTEARLDAACAVGFKEQVRELCGGHGGRVVLDMAKVDFLDSSGLGALVSVMKGLDGRTLELARTRGAVSRVLDLTRMDRVFAIHDDLPGGAAPGQDAA